MDPKDKAHQLASKFITNSIFDMTNDELKEERKMAKKNAIICVDEILENIEAIKIYHSKSSALPFNESYWKEVKEEINLL